MSSFSQKIYKLQDKKKKRLFTFSRCNPFGILAIEREGIEPRRHPPYYFYANWFTASRMDHVPSKRQRQAMILHPIFQRTNLAN